VPMRRTLVLGFMALGLVAASLGIDQRAQNEAAARHLGFGYPLHFAEFGPDEPLHAAVLSADVQTESLGDSGRWQPARFPGVMALGLWSACWLLGPSAERNQTSAT
jgi:hypothetical protein